MITVFYTYIDNWKWHQVSSSFVSANCKPFLFKSTNQPLRLQTYWRQDGGIPTHLTCCRFEVQALHPDLWAVTLPSSNGSSQYSIIETNFIIILCLESTKNLKLTCHILPTEMTNPVRQVSFRVSATPYTPQTITGSWTPLLRCIGLKLEDIAFNNSLEQQQILVAALQIANVPNVPDQTGV